MVGTAGRLDGPAAAVGRFLRDSIRSAGRVVRAQVVGFRDGRVLLMPLEETGGLQLGDTVVARGRKPRASRWARSCSGACWMDSEVPWMDGPAIEPAALYDLYATPPGPLEREHITEPLVTGVRAIDSLLPFGEGQRIGIFGGSGVGKSTLLGAHGAA